MNTKKKNPAIGQEKSGYAYYLRDVSEILKLPYSNIKFLGKGIKNEETYLVQIKNSKYIFKMANFSEPEIQRLRYLSELKLIPEIYKITPTYYIMEFINGVTVEDITDDSKPDLALKRYILSEVRKELEKWHKLGIYHGDLALKNIFLSKDGRIYLIDPWLSKEPLDGEHEIKKDKDYFKIFENKMLASRIRGRGALRKNPRYTNKTLTTKEEYLDYIYKNYRYRASEDVNLQKMLLNIRNIYDIKSGSQADVVILDFADKIYIQDEIFKSKTLVLPNKVYALRLAYTSGQCLSIMYKLSKFGLSPKIYFMTSYYQLMDYIDGKRISSYGPDAERLMDKVYKFYPTQISDANLEILRDKKGRVWFIDPCN